VVLLQLPHRHNPTWKEKRVSITRRGFVVGAATIVATAAAPRFSVAQTPAGPFKLDPLPYPTNALQPHIDAKTMEIHHDRHHQAYVTGLNNAVKDHSNVASMPLQDILAKLPEMPESIRTTLRNAGGGHANHTMFWQIMGPEVFRRRAILRLRLRAISVDCRNSKRISTLRAPAYSAPAGCSSRSPRRVSSPSRASPTRTRR
jgi:hypothetical protein